MRYFKWCKNSYSILPYLDQWNKNEEYTHPAPPQHILEFVVLWTHVAHKILGGHPASSNQSVCTAPCDRQKKLFCSLENVSSWQVKQTEKKEFWRLWRKSPNLFYRENLLLFYLASSVSKKNVKLDIISFLHREKGSGTQVAGASIHRLSTRSQWSFSRRAKTWTRSRRVVWPPRYLDTRSRQSFSGRVKTCTCTHRVVWSSDRQLWFWPWKHPETRLLFWISFWKPLRACIVHFRWFFLHPMRGGHWRISTNNREGRQQQKL